jgi:hypothetical protein
LTRAFLDTRESLVPGHFEKSHASDYYPLLAQLAVGLVEWWLFGELAVVEWDLGLEGADRDVKIASGMAELEICWRGR